MMTELLESGLSSRNGFVRKGSTALLQVPKWLASRRIRPGQLAAAPPVLANSVPKSGTHLLSQIVDGLPQRRNYGAFLSSMTSSFQFRERSVESVQRFLRDAVPGEVIRGHLFYDSAYADDLASQHFVHYFIYRDPRDVALSGAHYARTMNRWHKLHKYFRAVQSMDEAIELAIRGLQPPVPGVEFPNIAQRYGRYCDWLKDDNCLAIRYEALQSENRPEIVRQMAEFYAAHASSPIDMDAAVTAMLGGVAPTKSHTFRSGQKDGWRKSYTQRHRQLFHEIAGHLLIDLGYENDASWVDATEPAMP